MLVEHTECQPATESALTPIGPDFGSMTMQELTWAHGNAQITRNEVDQLIIGSILRTKMEDFMLDNGDTEDLRERLNNGIVNAINAHLQIQSEDDMLCTTFDPESIAFGYKKPKSTPLVKADEQPAKDNHSYELVVFSGESGRLSKLKLVTRQTAEADYADALRLDHLEPKPSVARTLLNRIINSAVQGRDSQATTPSEEMVDVEARLLTAVPTLAQDS